MEEVIEKELKEGNGLGYAAPPMRWIFGWVPFFALFGGIAALTSSPRSNAIWYILGGLLAFIVFMEWGVYYGRKKVGLPYWKNVEKEYRAVRMAELIKQRREAEERAGIKTEDKDLRYYHGLLKDGIISEDEFAKIKARFVG